jgi:hypothetical protein
MSSSELVHRLGCPGRRMETYRNQFDTGLWEITRCGDCGEQIQAQIGPPKATEELMVSASGATGAAATIEPQREKGITMRRAPTTETEQSYNLAARRKNA